MYSLYRLQDARAGEDEREVDAVLNPMGSEMARSRVTSLLAEAARESDARKARSERVRHREAGSFRVALGLRLVSVGSRVLGEAAEAR